MKGENVATCPIFSWRRVVSANIWQTSLLKIKKIMGFWFLLIFGTSDRRRMGPKEARRINAERKHKRMEKKEN